MASTNPKEYSLSALKSVISRTDEDIKRLTAQKKLHSEQANAIQAQINIMRVKLTDMKHAYNDLDKEQKAYARESRKKRPAGDKGPMQPKFVKRLLTLNTAEKDSQDSEPDEEEMNGHADESASDHTQDYGSSPDSDVDDDDDEYDNESPGLSASKTPALTVSSSSDNKNN